jgi:hypothetical protein
VLAAAGLKLTLISRWLQRHQLGCGGFTGRTIDSLPFTGVEEREINIFTSQLALIDNAGAMNKRVPKTISIDPEILKHGLDRAWQFRLNFSRHIERLIEDDYYSGKTRITLQAEPPPEPQ